MKMLQLTIVGLMCAMLMTACEEANNPPPTTVDPALPDSTPPADDGTMDDGVIDDGLPDTGDGALDDIPDPGTVGDDLGTQVTEATTLLGQLKDQIQAGNYDQARDTLSKLDEMKASLPTALQTQIESARTTLEAAVAPPPVEDIPEGEVTPEPAPTPAPGT